MPREIRTDASGRRYVVPTIAEIAAEGRPLVIQCFHPSCRRRLTLPPDEAVQLLGPNGTIEQADRRLRCTSCGARGRDGFVQARFDPPLVGRRP